MSNILGRAEAFCRANIRKCPTAFLQSGINSHIKLYLVFVERHCIAGIPNDGMTAGAEIGAAGVTVFRAAGLFDLRIDASILVFKSFSISG